MKIFCCNRNTDKEHIEKIKAAQERVRSASKTFLSTAVVTQSSQVVLHQATAPLWPEPILEDQEDSRACSVGPQSIKIEVPDIYIPRNKEDK